MSASNSSSIKIWREIYERLANVLYRPATVNGVLNIEPSGRVLPEDAIKSNPEIKNILEEILSKNWKYIYIDVHGTYYIKTELTGTTCRLIPHTVSPRGDPESYAVYIHLGNKLPEITIKNLEEFSINVTTKNFPRAVRVDLVKRVITYIENIFWEWNDEWINDQEKLSRALEVYEVVKWFIKEKGFTLHETLDAERCKELLEKFNILSSPEKLRINKVQPFKDKDQEESFNSNP